MSKSLQTCSYCGWSKVTSYQGLRTHQGKMGCTPKGLSIPQSVYNQYSPQSYKLPPVKEETYASPKYNPQPSTKMGCEPRAETQEKLRSCHCGWTKVTSYQGLRIHQGKMGCTPKGLGIPEHLQDLFNPSAPKIEATPTKPREKLPSVNDRTMSDNKTLQVCHCGWSSVTTYHGLRTHQGIKGCTPKKSITSPEHTKPDTAQIIFNTYMPKITYTLPPFEQQGHVHLDLDENMVNPRHLLKRLESDQTQSRLMFLTSKPLEVESPQMFRSENDNEAETRPPTAGMWQTQPMPFGPQQTPALADLTVKNVPLFGSAQQPLQPPDHGNKTHSALDSIVGAQFTKPTSSSQTSTANTAATNEKENTTLFQSPPQPSQPVLSRTQMFGQTSGPQANSNWSNVVTEMKKGTQQSQPSFTGATSQTTFDFNSKQQTFIKPASFTPQHIASNTGDEPMDLNFGTTLPNFSMFADIQSQSVFGWPTGAQQFQMRKTEPPNAQTTGANNTTPMEIEMPGSSLLKGLLVSDRALQQPSAYRAYLAAQENKPMFGSAQQPLQTSEFSRGQQFAKPTSSSQTSTANTSATNEKENKPLFPSPQQPCVLSRTQGFGQTSAPQANSKWPHVATETKEETQQYFGTLRNFSMFGDRQSQSAFGWPTGAHQFQITKTEPPKAQTTAANNTPPMEKPGSSLSDGALQQQSLGANPVAAKENQSNIASPQSQSPSFSAQSVTSTTRAQQPLYRIPTTQPRPKTSEGALKEHKTVSSSRPPPSIKPTGAPQTGSVKEEQSGPVTPKTVPQKENEQFFETPKVSHQSAPEGNKTRRALDFSTGAQQLQQDQIKAELQQKIKSRKQKLSEIKSCVEACKGSLDKELLVVNNLFSDVIRSVKKARQRARQPLENRKDKLERDSQSIIKKIQEDIKKLDQAIDEVDTAADLVVDPLSKLKIKNSSKWTVDTSFSFGTLQQTVFAMMEQIQEELEKLAALELQRAPAFAVDVKLDPTTAHQSLIISNDGKKVQDGGQNQQQQLPLAAERFDMFGSILGANELRSGRAYWEVQVGGKTGWDLGVASAKANRKGKLTLSPDKGYWAISHYEGENYAALAAPPVCLQLKEKPQKVGVFWDFEEGLVSFYNVTNQSHIYSFTKCSFNDTIFPYFSPHLKQNGKNSEPLVITAVKN